ncbi:MAG TPA: FAD-linked oxidase C-terminal domain-containing protein, partial [Thermoanaerobaculia bacterium]|nr:FAD-linked oxidase C-terminal domain-containing protein [Thermoanaerobaculia bacterium]
MDYGRVTPEVVAELKEAVGEDSVVTDPDALRPFASDYTEDLVFMPDVAVLPRTTDEVQRMVRIADRHRIPLTPRAGGTGLSGGALPVLGGILFSCHRMNRILEIDRENLVGVVEPGVITQVFQEEVEKVGLFYPPDPASRGSCTLGGNVAENAGGPRAVKYGVTKDYVLGIEAVLPDGTLIKAGGKLYKDVTGYNLTQLLVGSEGTLAILTKLWMRLIPWPPHRKVLLAPFGSFEAAAKAVVNVFTKGVQPSACELMERDAVECAVRQLGKEWPHAEAAAHLLLEVDGHSMERVDEEAMLIGEACMEAGADDVLLADDERRMREIWSLRRSIGEAVRSVGIYKEEDTVVPRSRIPELIAGVKEIAARYGLTTICYGHAGDGNIHCNIIKTVDDETWNGVLPSAIREIFEHTAALGGQVSGEHGIGWVQREFLPITRGAAEIALMRKIKDQFDPRGILNPGKIFP